MSTLVPRLWPFLSHSTSSVRKSTLITLQTLTSSNTVIKHESSAGSTASSSSSSSSATDGQSVAALQFDSKQLKLNFGVIDWQWKLLQEALRHIYQRILVEPQPEIQLLAQRVWINLIENANLSALLHAACPFVSSWICLAMQPPRLAFDMSSLIHANSSTATTPNSLENSTSGCSSSSCSPRRRTARDDLGGRHAGAHFLKLYLGGSESTPIEIREKNYIRARITAARVLGALSHFLVQPAPGVVYTPNMDSPLDCYTKVLLGHLTSRSAVQRIVCGRCF